MRFVAHALQDVKPQTHKIRIRKRVRVQVDGDGNEREVDQTQHIKNNET